MGEVQRGESLSLWPLRFFSFCFSDEIPCCNHNRRMFIDYEIIRHVNLFFVRPSCFSYISCEIRRSHNRVAEDLRILVCHAMSVGNEWPTFRKKRSAFVASVRQSKTLKMMALQYFETSVNIYRSVQRIFAEDLNVQGNSCPGTCHCPTMHCYGLRNGLSPGSQ